MSVRVRPALPEDSGEILRLLHLLAAFEGEPDGVATTEAIIRRDGFGPDRRFEALLTEVDGTVRGMAVLYQAYSSWRGAPTLVVHDLFVEEEARGTGAGSALLSAAAALASQLGCCRMDVNVLDWNNPARRFYGQRGFTPVEGWRIHRLDRAGIERLVRAGGQGGEPPCG
jgi:GNAT superfamily N-acetyltransferase